MVARRSRTPAHVKSSFKYFSGEKFVRTCGFSRDNVMSLSGVHMATLLMQERTSTGKDNRGPS